MCRLNAVILHRRPNLQGFRCTNSPLDWCWAQSQRKQSNVGDRLVCVLVYGGVGGVGGVINCWSSAKEHKDSLDSENDPRFHAVLSLECSPRGRGRGQCHAKMMDCDLTGASVGQSVKNQE